MHFLNLVKQKFNELLIIEVKSKLLIYNKGIPEYKDRYKKEQCWQNEATVLGVEGIFCLIYTYLFKYHVLFLVTKCKKRWTNLRETFASLFKQNKNYFKWFWGTKKLILAIFLSACIVCHY